MAIHCDDVLISTPTAPMTRTCSSGQCPSLTAPLVFTTSLSLPMVNDKDPVIDFPPHCVSSSGVRRWCRWKPRVDLTLRVCHALRVTASNWRPCLSACCRFLSNSLSRHISPEHTKWCPLSPIQHDHRMRRSSPSWGCRSINSRSKKSVQS
jgi:hypothetical protein